MLLRLWLNQGLQGRSGPNIVPNIVLRRALYSLAASCRAFGNPVNSFAGARYQQTMGHVQEGDTVVFDENGEKKAIIKIKPGRQVGCCVCM